MRPLHHYNVTLFIYETLAIGRNVVPTPTKIKILDSKNKS